jgi:WD40 repeat protein
MDTLAAAAGLTPLRLPSTTTSEAKTVTTNMATVTPKNRLTTSSAVSAFAPDSPNSGVYSSSYSPQVDPAGGTSTAEADPSASFSVQFLCDLRSLWQSQTMCDLTLRAVCAGPNDPAALLLLSPRQRRIREIEREKRIAAAATTEAEAAASAPSTENSNNNNNATEWWDVKLHSVVAMCASPLLRELITNKAQRTNGVAGQDAQQSSPLSSNNIVIELDPKCVSSHALRTIVAFMYNGRLELHSEREILAVVLAAHFLQMPTVVQTCARLLGKSLAAQNAAHLLALSIQLSLRDLGILATQCIVDNYAVVSATRGWASLSVDAVEEILRADSLCCDEESQVIEGLIVWALFSSYEATEKVSRKDSFNRLVNDRECVRLAHVSSEALPTLVDRLRTEFTKRIASSHSSTSPKFRVATRPGNTSASSSPLSSILRPAPVSASSDTSSSNSATPSAIKGEAEVETTVADKYAVEKQKACDMLEVLLSSLRDAVQTEVELRKSNKRLRVPRPRRYTTGRGLPRQCSYAFNDADRHCGYVYTLTECDGIIYSGSRDSTIKLWSMYSKQCVDTVPVNNRVWKLLAVRPGDPCPRLHNHIVSGSWDNVIRIWRKYPNFGPNCSYELRGHRGWILDLLVVAGTLVSASADCSVIVWNLATRKPLVSLLGHTKHVYALASVGGFLISAGADMTVRVWNTSSWKCKHVMAGHTNTVRALLRVGDRLWSGAADGSIKVWDCDAGKCLKTIVGHTDWVESLVNMDSDFVASGSRDETIKLWDSSTYECVRVLRGHENWVYSLAVRSNQALISGSADASVRVWEFGTADRAQGTDAVADAGGAATLKSGDTAMSVSPTKHVAQSGEVDDDDLSPKRARVRTSLLALNKHE